MAATTTEDGPSFTAFLDGLYGRLLSPDFVANLVKENKIDLKLFLRSKDVLFSFEDVSDAAEDKQLRDPAVMKWLDPIKDAFYVADDLLNQIDTKSEPLEEVRMLKGIIHRLESILEHKDYFGLKQKSSVKYNKTQTVSRRSKYDRIYGRDADKEAVMELLLKDYSDANISVIPIVGKGGVGKSTLAQLVYNDDILKLSFDLKAWVCVPEDFDMLKITKNMIEAVTSSPCNMDEGLNSLQLHLKEKLSGKKFLFVLDDIWNISSDDWNVLLSPFQYGTKGSKILVTTHSQKVASSLVQTGGEVYELKQLSDEDIWLMLCDDEDLSYIQEQIGIVMVRKCEGLPFVAKILRDLLQAQLPSKDGKTILQSDIQKLSENGSVLAQVMELSYRYLPAPLKRCFAFCSLFPKDYKFNKDELILIWMAHGLFLLPSNSEKTSEEIGHEYFHELVSRSFIQPFSIDGSYGSFLIPNLIHEFAMSKANELRTFLPLNLKEDWSTTILSPSRCTRCIQIHPFPPSTLPTISSLSILQHQWMISIRIWNLRLKIELWRLVGFVSGVVGMICLALSPSFSHLIGGWNSFKFFLYGVVIFILCITTMFAEKCTLSRRGMLKAYVGFVVLILTSLYSLWHDKAVNGKPDLWSMISNGAFALMSLSLSRVLKLGFEEGLFTFFLGSLVIQLATIKLVLILVAIVYGLPLYLIHSRSNADSDYLPSVRNSDE